MDTPPPGFKPLILESHELTLSTKNKPVLVIGVFDLFHRGHVELLRRARDLGSALYVIVNGDKFTEIYKRRKPLMSEEDRLVLVSACRYVDSAIISNEYDIKPTIERFGIKVIVHGNDWPRESYLNQVQVSEDYLLNHGIEMIFTPYWVGESTSKLVHRIRQGADEA